MTNVTPFSAVIRRQTRTQHSQAEATGFLTDLLSGAGTAEDYAAMVAQHFFIYRALETAAETMKNDPVAAPFITPQLTRLPAIRADLEFLIGPDWEDQVSPLPATIAYVERIEQVAAVWNGGFVAHHYTRYLGDLSGGQMIKELLQKHYGFDTNGVGFYIFAEVADPTVFKDAYRAQLDKAPRTEAEKERVLAEVVVSYGLNSALFDDLGTARAEAIA